MCATATTEHPHQHLSSLRHADETVPLPPDTREQLYNGGAVGPIEEIQVSTERIVQLRGILFDLDPQNLRGAPLLPEISCDAEQFYEQCLRPWMTHHPLLENLEVRSSGRGLHAILWLDPAVSFTDESERKRWCALVKIVQAVLPTDPLAPGITATTRAVGSRNSKNGQLVQRLQRGTPVLPAEVIGLGDQMCAAPFKTVMQVLTGAERLTPCPWCATETLVALDHVGTCYGCGRVSFERLCNELFQPRKSVEA